MVLLRLSRAAAEGQWARGEGGGEGGQGGEEEKGGRDASENIKEVALFLNCLSVHQDYRRYL